MNAEFSDAHWDFSEEEVADIQLCLTCPHAECYNCLEKNHVPGVRPVRQIDERRKRAEHLLLNTNLTIWKVAKLAHMSDRLVRKVQEELRAEGRL